MTWVEDPPNPFDITHRATHGAYKFILTYEKSYGARVWRATICDPKEGDYTIVRCDELDEAKRFCEWVARAYDPKLSTLMVEF